MSGIKIENDTMFFGDIGPASPRVAKETEEQAKSDDEEIPPPPPEAATTQPVAKDQRKSVRQSITNQTRMANAKGEDFEYLKILGEGGFGMVLRVKHKETGIHYAMKVLDRNQVSEDNDQQEELQILQGLDHFSIVKIKYWFTVDQYDILVLDLICGGTYWALHKKRKEKPIPVAAARIYGAQVLCALEYMHGINIIYRDLKPDNVMFDLNGNMQLTDLGLAFRVSSSRHPRMERGARGYKAPEMMMPAKRDARGKRRKMSYSFSVDWWNFGLMMYMLLSGKHPFIKKYEERNTNRRVMDPNVKMPLLVESNGITAAANDLLLRLLDRNPKTRLGAELGAAEIKQHPFFAPIDWESMEKGVEPNWKAIKDWNFKPVIKPKSRRKPAWASLNDFLAYMEEIRPDDNPQPRPAQQAAKPVNRQEQTVQQVMKDLNLG